MCDERIAMVITFRRYTFRSIYLDQRWCQSRTKLIYAYAAIKHLKQWWPRCFSLFLDIHEVLLKGLMIAAPIILIYL